MTLSHVAKEVAKAVLPQRLAVSIQSCRSRRYIKHLLWKSGHAAAALDLARICGYKVLHGPFQGLLYSAEALISTCGVPILLGTYELELHKIIDSISPGRYERIIDVGCAEGYYAVGLARNTGADVYAFDAALPEQTLCRELARLNGVEGRVIVSGWCDQSALCRLAVGRSLIISDCEGYESQLFSLDVVPRLRMADLIIELHETDGTRRVEQAILQRFSDSHRTELVSFSPEVINPVFLGELERVPNCRRYLREDRQRDQRWVHLETRSL